MSRNQIRMEFESTTPFGGGKSFGKTGPYEWLHGMVSFAIDPNEKDLPFICDLEFAPRNAEGLVEFKAVIDMVKPVDMSKSNRKLLFDFSNRGGRGAFTRLERRRRRLYQGGRRRQRLSQPARLHGCHRGLARRSGLYRKQRRRLRSGGAPERPAAARQSAPGIYFRPEGRAVDAGERRRQHSMLSRAQPRHGDFDPARERSRPARSRAGERVGVGQGEGGRRQDRAHAV